VVDQIAAVLTELVAQQKAMHTGTSSTISVLPPDPMRKQLEARKP
jgi:hypothetical protein